MATEQQVKVVITGEDKTGAAFKSAGKNVSLLQTDVSGLMKTVGAGVLAGGAALTAFLYSSAKGAADAEVQIGKVTATLKAMGEGALKNKDAILEASQAAVKLGFDDEAAALSITKFYQRTNDLTKAQELNNLAMDLARAKHLDLETATNLVGQALSGNGRVLSAYGISIKDSASALEALGELHKVVGGQAQAYAGTFKGQMDILDESVSNLKDTIGAALLEAIMPFIKQLTEWANKKEVQEKIKEIATAIGTFVKEALPVAIETIKIWKAAFDGIVDVLSDIILGIENVIAAIGRMANAIKNSAIGKAIGGTVSGAVSEIKYLAGARASGGPVAGGSSYLVGEHGPEIFSPSTSGFITPNGGGGITINITGNTLLDSSAGERIAEQIMQTLRNNLRI